MSSPRGRAARRSARCPGRRAGPANVPLADQCTATWSPSATMSSTSKRRSGHRAEELGPVGAHAVGARRPGLADDVADAVGRPGGGDRVEVLVRQRLEVGGHDGLRSRALSCSAMPGQYRPAPCASRPDRGRWGAASACSRASGGCGCRCRGRASRTATRGRSRRAPAIVLVDTGTHEPGSLGHLERALDQVRLQLEDVRLVVITHAHADHCGQAHPIADRAGCEVWAHPNHQHFSAYADDPDAAHARRVEIARQSGVPRDPPRSRPLARRRPARAPTATCSPASTSRPTSAAGACTRRPATRRRTSCLFQRERRLLISGDHLLGRVSLYFDYGWTPDPVGEFLASLDVDRALGARLALSGHGRPFADVARARRGQPRGSCGGASTPCSRPSRDGPSTAYDLAPGRLRRGASAPRWRAGC